jgi:hypothetical protein
MYYDIHSLMVFPNLIVHGKSVHATQPLEIMFHLCWTNLWFSFLVEALEEVAVVTGLLLASIDSSSSDILLLIMLGWVSHSDIVF